MIALFHGFLAAGEEPGVEGGLVVQEALVVNNADGVLHVGVGPEAEWEGAVEGKLGDPVSQVGATQGKPASHDLFLRGVEGLVRSFAHDVVAHGHEGPGHRRVGHLAVVRCLVPADQLEARFK